MSLYDVVIPLGPKDEDIVQRCVTSVRKHVVGVRYIFVIAHKKMDISGAAVLEESLFPFSRAVCAEKTSEARAGWYLQQLLKFYAPLLISDAMENVLIVDADTVFQKRTRFTENGKTLVDKTMIELHQPYFDHMARLHPSFTVWKRMNSGITNVMVFNRTILFEMMKKAEDLHKKHFWEAYLDCVTLKDKSGASEYEVYFHYLMNNHADKVRVRPLQWTNDGQRAVVPTGDWHYQNYHWHNQKALPPRSSRLR